MARHTQPRELAELKGAHKANPQRYRKEAPKSEYALGSAPDHLSPGAKAVWFELETYALTGVLTGADRLIMETTSVLVSQFRADPEGFPGNRLGHLIGCLARLGLTPADRQKLGMDKPPEDNPFNDF